MIYNKKMLFIFDMGGVVTTTFDMKIIFNKLNTTKNVFFSICGGNDFDNQNDSVQKQKSCNNNKNDSTFVQKKGLGRFAIEKKDIETVNIWKELEIGGITTEQFWTEFNRRVNIFQRELFDGFVKIGSTIKCKSEINEQDMQNIPQVETDLFRLYFNPKLHEKTAELIRILRKNHRVVCGTNTIQSHWENHLERGDYALFDKTYASNKINCAKPDPYFFESILEAEGYQAKDTFFVDDKIENCKAAESVGITTHLMKTQDELFDAWKNI